MSELETHLTFEMRHRLGALNIDVAFELTQTWTVLFGPSGSGKSTILRAIAGLMRPDQAKIVLRWNKKQQVATDTARRLSMPPHKRRVRWAGQSPALFPHMTVRDNLYFVSKSETADSERAIGDAMDCFRLASLADRKPRMLSGGEQQRVSIARAAIAANGRLLLLDEPFSGLDAPLRDELIMGLLLWVAQTKTPVLSVTHDLAEALQLRAEVIKIREGRVVAQGPAASVLADERERLVALLKGQTSEPVERARTSGESVPQRLKPSAESGSVGTAEAVPLSKTEHR